MGLPPKPAGQGGERRSWPDHGQAPKQQQQHQQQSTSGPAQHTRSKTTGPAPASPLRLELVGTRPPQKRWLRKPNLLRLRRLRRMVTTTCTFACHGRRWRQWIPGSPRRCSTIFSRALGRKTQFRCSCRHRRRSSGLEIPVPCRTRVSVLQPGGSGDTSVDTVDTEPHLEALTQHVAGRLAIPGASAAAEVKVLMDSGSEISAMSEELVEALRRQG